MSKGRLLPAFGLLSVAIGCESTSAPDAKDIENLPQWSVSEDLRIGSLDDPDAGFSSIGTMVLGDDGLLYVLESQDRQIRVFDMAGRRARVVGRQGRGPGEFEEPDAIGFVGDTLWVAETMGNRRVTLFHRDGTLLATVPALNKRFVGRTGRLWVELMPAALEPGGTLTSTYLYTAGGAAGDTVIFPRVRFNLHGHVIDTVGWDTVGMSAGRPRMTIGHVTASAEVRHRRSSKDLFS